MTRPPQPLGDRSLRRRCLMNRPAGTTAILPPADAQHAQARRHEVEHLADVLTDRMKSAATAGAIAAREVDGYVFTRQAVWKRLTSWSSFRTVINEARRHRRLRPGNVDIEILEPKCKLITVEPLRPATELRALQTLNDQSEVLDLGARLRQFGSLVSGLSGQLAHQPMQGIDVGGKRGEIEIHPASLTPACGSTHADHCRESIRRKPANGQSLLTRLRPDAISVPGRANRHRRSGVRTAQRSSSTSRRDRCWVAKGRRRAQAVW